MVVAHGMHMTVGEDQLVTRCRAGDLDAFSQVYDRYERQIYRYAYHILGHRDDADDIKQETFVKAYQAIGSFRSEGPASRRGSSEFAATSAETDKILGSAQSYIRLHSSRRRSRQFG